MPISKETFSLGHSLITNKIPPSVPLLDVDKLLADTSVDTEQFGLFNSASPDFNKFYPDVKPEDLEPKEEDFAYPIFRALSKVIVNKYGPIDFGDKSVLKNSLVKLIGQTVYSNHEALVGNEVGSVSDAVWQNATIQNGVTVPGGINVKLKLDGKSNPKLVRGTMMDPPSVHSVSVTVSFSWKQSHPKLDENDFYNLVGTYDADGQLVRRVVDDILAYHEISFVTHGADPYAQRIEDGKINNPEYAAGQVSFSADDFRNMGSQMDYKGFTDILSFTEDKTILYNFNNKLPIKQNSSMKKETLVFLIGYFGLSTDSDEGAVTKVLLEKLPGYSNLQAELDTANALVKNFQTKYPEGSILLKEGEQGKLDTFDGLKEIADATLKSTRNEALRLQGVLAGEGKEVDATLKGIIETADFNTALAFKNQFAGQVEEKFDATCDDCGSHKVSRASAGEGADGVVIPGAEGEQGSGGEDNKPLSNDEAVDKLRAKFLGQASGGLHIEVKKK